METKAQKTLKNKQQKPLTVKIFMATVPVLLTHINTQFREGIKHKIHIKIMKKGGEKAGLPHCCRARGACPPP